MKMISTNINNIGLVKRLFFQILYLRDPIWNTGIAPPELMEFISHHKPGKAIDLGCGTGTNAIALAQNGWETTGVDFVSKAIRQARKKAESEGLDINFALDDVTKLNKINDKFELVLDIGCFHSLSPKAKKNYLFTIERVLKEKGHFLIYTWISDSANDSVGLTDFDLKEFSKELNLLNREVGTERGYHPSVWLTFERR